VGKAYEQTVDTEIQKWPYIIQRERSYDVSFTQGRKRVRPDWTLIDLHTGEVFLADAKSTLKTNAGAIPYDAQAKGFLEVATREKIDTIFYFTKTGARSAISGTYLQEAKALGIDIIVAQIP
jgi:hypothetical protein